MSSQIDWMRKLWKLMSKVFQFIFLSWLAGLLALHRFKSSNIDLINLWAIFINQTMGSSSLSSTDFQPISLSNLHSNTWKLDYCLAFRARNAYHCRYHVTHIFKVCQPSVAIQLADSWLRKCDNFSASFTDQVRLGYLDVAIAKKFAKLTCHLVL